MKNTDIVRQAIAIFQQLQQRRSQLQQEIEEIDQALGQIQNVAPAAARTPAAQPVTKGTQASSGNRRGLGGNAMPLREALTQVLRSGPKTKDELLSGVKQLGYKFSSKDPMNSLQTFLYAGGKKLFQKVDGKRFALIGGAAKSALAAKVSAAAPAKRTMSAEARQRISEAVKARWAKQKGGKTQAAKPAKAKGTMSPEARQRISEAVKARWAAQKKAAKK